MSKALCILLVSLILLVGCASPTQTQVTTSPSNTPLPPSPASASGQTNSGPTRTPLPTELAGQMDATYQAMVLVQLYSELTLETAKRVSSGEITRADTFNPFIAIGAYFKSVDDSTQEINPPTFMDAEYQQALALQADFRDIYERWSGDTITAEQTIDEITPITQQIEEILVQVEANVASEFNLDPAQLRTTRDRLRAKTPLFFITPTPQP